MICVMFAVSGAPGEWKPPGVTWHECILLALKVKEKIFSGKNNPKLTRNMPRPTTKKKEVRSIHLWAQSLVFLRCISLFYSFVTNRDSHFFFFNCIKLMKFNFYFVFICSRQRSQILKEKTVQKTPRTRWGDCLNERRMRRPCWNRNQYGFSCILLLLTI
jgi:hypothetical protein